MIIEIPAIFIINLILIITTITCYLICITFGLAYKSIIGVSGSSIIGTMFLIILLNINKILEIKIIP